MESISAMMDELLTAVRAGNNRPSELRTIFKIEQTCLYGRIYSLKLSGLIEIKQIEPLAGSKEKTGYFYTGKKYRINRKLPPPPKKKVHATEKDWSNLDEWLFRPAHHLH